jgi:predicted alpha/beta hydrolase
MKTNQGMGEVLAQPINFATPDGASLAGTWFRSDLLAPRTVVVVAGGGGIPAAFYKHLARYAASQGAAVLTFDYRGIAASRQGSLRGLHVGIEDWATQDFGAALLVARSTYPELPVAVITHSIGALLVGAAPNASEIGRLVFFGAHTGYYGDYRAHWRLPLFIVWHAFMPAVTKMVGYFPARALGLGHDLPRQVALDWAGRRQPELIATSEHQRRFGATLGRYAGLRARTLAISISDDLFAPPAAGARCLSLYPNIDPIHKIVTPASLGRRRLGHFAFLRRPTATHLWDQALAWILLDMPGGRASHQGVSRSGVPPSGTKEDALAGSTASQTTCRVP